jgi:perosamine synthetase
VAAAYAASLGALDWLTIPQAGPDEVVDWFVYVVRLDPSIDRDRLIEDLSLAGVPARPYFSPLHLQPFYREQLGHAPGDFPVTERIASSTLALPWSPLMSEDDVAYVAEALTAAVAGGSRAAGR